MANYAKMWSDQWEDEWWLGLSCLERGLYAQMITWAKRSGDTGHIFFTNLQHFSCIFALDMRTSRKILAKMSDLRKVEWSIDNKMLRIFLCNYDKNQRVKKPTDRKNVTKMQQKCPYNKIREDKGVSIDPIFKKKNIKT